MNFMKAHEKEMWVLRVSSLYRTSPAGTEAERRRKRPIRRPTASTSVRRAGPGGSAVGPKNSERPTTSLPSRRETEPTAHSPAFSAARSRSDEADADSADDSPAASATAAISAADRHTGLWASSARPARPSPRAHSAPWLRASSSEPASEGARQNPVQRSGEP